MPEMQDRFRFEGQFAGAVGDVFDRYRDQALRDPNGITWPDMAREVAAATQPTYEELFAVAFILWWMNEDLGQPSRADINQRATSYSRRTATELGAAVAGTSREKVARAQQQREAGRISDREYRQRIETTFDRDRAGKIGSTEVTRTISVGEQAGRREAEQRLPLVITPIWITERDARVCPICRPLDRQPEARWEARFPSGPPAHPNCRCFLEYEVQQRRETA